MSEMDQTPEQLGKVKDPVRGVTDRWAEVSRVEIIGPGGRIYVGYFQPGVAESLQDEGRTLKIYVGEETLVTGKLV